MLCVCLCLFYDVLISKESRFYVLREFLLKQRLSFGNLPFVRITRDQNHWTQKDISLVIQTLTKFSQKLHYWPKWYCVGFQTLSVWPKNFFYVIVWFLWIFRSCPYIFRSCLAEQWKTQCYALLENDLWWIQFFNQKNPRLF